ncbi:MAG TPA: holo-ACP synthase [Thermoanaerobaculaceae bacterium]|nr:holo-ACP synthase [Thermoanaerobaculaceae bacterium]
MIVGVGADVFDVRRMARELEEGGAALRESLFTPDEIADCEGTHAPAQHYAARAAAKEAAAKALGVGLASLAAWRDAEVRRDPRGRPSLRLHGGLERAAARLGVSALALSLSHTAELAVAVVVAESAAPGSAPDAAGAR